MVHQLDVRKANEHRSSSLNKQKNCKENDSTKHSLEYTATEDIQNVVAHQSNINSFFCKPIKIDEKTNNNDISRIKKEMIEKCQQRG